MCNLSSKTRCTFLMFYFGGFLSANKLSLRFYELVFLKRSKGGQRPTGRSVFNFFFLFSKVDNFIAKILGLRWTKCDVRIWIFTPKIVKNSTIFNFSRFSTYTKFRFLARKFKLFKKTWHWKNLKNHCFLAQKFKTILILFLRIRFLGHNLRISDSVCKSTLDT